MRRGGAQLRRIPRRPIGRAHQPALPGAGNARQPAAKRKVDELDVMHGDVRSGISPADPFGELARGLYREEGIDARFLLTSKNATGAAAIYAHP